MDFLFYGVDGGEAAKNDAAGKAPDAWRTGFAALQASIGRPVHGYPFEL
jgi:hypothetical protein